MNLGALIRKECGESDEVQDVSEYLTTGFLPLNRAISGRYSGGLGVGRIAEIFGAESSGKTMIATMVLAHTQRLGGFGIFLDFEHAFSLSRAMQLGLSNDPALWYYRQPATADEGFELISKACNAAGKDGKITVVVDSVASMVTKEAMDAGLDGQNMKTKLSLAALMSQKIPILNQDTHNTNTTVIFLNQTRKNPGVMFGDAETTPGGTALKFYASTRLKMTRLGKETDDDKNVIGEKVKCTVIKNKIHRPFEEAQFIVHYAEGVNLELSHIMDLKNRGLLGDTKGWLTLPSGEKFRADALVSKCKENPEFYNGLILSMYQD